MFAYHYSGEVIRGSILFLAAILIQGRLLCNLLDGMVAIEGGLATPAGPVYNELPDRVSDTLIFIGVGHGLIDLPYAGTLGWITALMALMTAYLRLLGGNCGLVQSFAGPMAKQHRMATLFVCSLAAIFLPVLYGQALLFIGLVVISVGAAITCWRRGQYIIEQLNNAAMVPEAGDE
ncbi:CDP-alcohol phosphatidyltransferase family protein [Shimwellia pseudoproteus]|uniref:CDP-alcohol phosphatidyltransferase family protein n=1 Tax=Shimwellia pseudoproteus TaxID=570012 RepID=UPI001E5CFB04